MSGARGESVLPSLRRLDRQRPALVDARSDHGEADQREGSFSNRMSDRRAEDWGGLTKP